MCASKLNFKLGLFITEDLITCRIHTKQPSQTFLQKVEISLYQFQFRGMEGSSHGPILSPSSPTTNISDREELIAELNITIQRLKATNTQN